MIAVETADFGPMAAIVAMAAATHLLRLGGFWMMARVPLTPRVRKMLDALPGAVVAATITPLVMSAGLPAALGIAAVIALMILRRNEFLAVFGAMGLVALARAAGL